MAGPDKWFRVGFMLFQKKGELFLSSSETTTNFPTTTQPCLSLFQKLYFFLRIHFYSFFAKLFPEGRKKINKFCEENENVFYVLI